MRRIFLLISLLMLLPAWAAAQSRDASDALVPQAARNAPSNGAEQNPSGKTVEGILKQGDSNFTLTDQRTGESFLLTGQMTADLTADVGHVVRVKGKIANSGADQPGAMASPQANEEPTLQVISIRRVSSPAWAAAPSRDASDALVPQAARNAQ